jgi:hypothetical protein
MRVCRSRQDLTFQYPCSPLTKGGEGTLIRVQRFSTESLRRGRFFPARACGQARLFALTPCVPLSRAAGEGDMECGSGASARR